MCTCCCSMRASLFAPSPLLDLQGSRARACATHERGTATGYARLKVVLNVCFKLNSRMYASLSLHVLAAPQQLVWGIDATARRADDAESAYLRHRTCAPLTFGATTESPCRKCGLLLPLSVLTYTDTCLCAHAQRLTDAHGCIRANSLAGAKVG
jgi:hypothetical protein